MPTSAILFAMLSGVSAATWTICLKLGSTKINAALGAMVIAAVALLVNSAAMFTLRAHGHEIVREIDAEPVHARNQVPLIALAGRDLRGSGKR